jgi:hypothetical protein
MGGMENCASKCTGQSRCRGEFIHNHEIRPNSIERFLCGFASLFVTTLVPLSRMGSPSQGKYPGAWQHAPSSQGGRRRVLANYFDLCALSTVAIHRERTKWLLFSVFSRAGSRQLTADLASVLPRVAADHQTAGPKKLVFVRRQADAVEHLKAPMLCFSLGATQHLERGKVGAEQFSGPPADPATRDLPPASCPRLFRGCQ